MATKSMKEKSDTNGFFLRAAGIPSICSKGFARYDALLRTHLAVLGNKLFVAHLCSWRLSFIRFPTAPNVYLRYKEIKKNQRSGGPGIKLVCDV